MTSVTPKKEKVRVFVATFIKANEFTVGFPEKGMYLFLEITKDQRASNLICYSEEAITCSCRKCMLNRAMAKDVKCEYLVILGRMRGIKGSAVLRIKQGAIFSEVACCDIYSGDVGSIGAAGTSISTFVAQNIEWLFSLSQKKDSEAEITPGVGTYDGYQERKVTRFVLNAQINRDTPFPKLPSTFSDNSCRQVLQKLQGKGKENERFGVPLPKVKVVTLLDGARKKILRPKENEFYVEPKVWDQLLYSLGTGSNTLLLGPAGCGKSELLEVLADKSGRPLFPFNFGAMTEPRTALLGNVNLDPKKGTWFSESRFIKAIQTPNAIVMLDELSRAPIDAFNILLPLLDGQKYLSLDESEDKGTVTTAEGVTFLATANIGMEYTGTGTMDRALRDRFASVDLEFPPEDKEIEVIHHRTKLAKLETSWLVLIANKQRKLAREGQYVEQISTRVLIQVANQIVFGISISQAIAYGMESLFSGEGGVTSDRTKVMLIVKATIPVARMRERAEPEVESVTPEEIAAPF